MSSRRHRFLGQAAGYTLIELLVVVGIGSALASMAFMNGATLLANFRMNSALRQIAYDLQLVRAKTVGQNHRFCAIFDANGNGYRVQRDDETGNCGDWSEYALYSRSKDDAGSPQPISLADPQLRFTTAQMVVFEPRGNAAASATVTLRHPVLSGTRSVQVNLGGQILVQ